MTTIKIGDKFVACWGYDQTQYSIYNVVDVKGRYVLVEGLNGWSGLDASDMAPGATVKIYSFKQWENVSDAKKEEWNNDRWVYNRHMRKQAVDIAHVRTIRKVNRIDGQSWSYIWELDNGETIRSDDNSKLNRYIEIVHGVKRCLVTERPGCEPRIKIDDVTTAYLDTAYDANHKRYAEQNEYTAYNGR